MICYFHPFFFLLAGGAGVAIVSCKSDGRGTSTDDMLLATIDVCQCKSLDTARSSNPSPPSIIGSARCMSYNMSYDMSYPEHLALHNMQGGVANTFALALYSGCMHQIRESGSYYQSQLQGANMSNSNE